VNVVLLGPPGSGKGTQAGILSKEFSLHHLALGELLREAIREGTALGREAKRFVEAGVLVPDRIVIDLVEERIGKGKSRDFLFDGFPRTVAQAEALEQLLPIHRVISLWVQEKDLLPRISERQHCATCGESYHPWARPPKTPGRCDRCDGTLARRKDDDPEVVLERLKTYLEQTSPLLGFYKARGTLQEIDGSGSIQEVTARIRPLLSPGRGIS